MKELGDSSCVRVTKQDVWKGDSCCTSLAKELESIKELVETTKIVDEVSMPECMIYYESWQIQCCGDPFAVGDTVNWTCVASSGYKNAHGILIDFEEDHHGFATHAITGQVDKIIAERSEFEKGKKVVWYDKATCIHEELTSANGWESRFTDTEDKGHTFWGYIVRLKDVTVKPITEERTFDD